MAESSDFARRVFVEDVRSDGKYLRVTWHPELPGFIVSNWDGDVCVGATRVPVDEAPKLIQLLTNGMADALVNERGETPNGQSMSSQPPASPARHRISLLRSRVARLLRRDRRTSTRHDEVADVVDLSLHRTRLEDEPMWSSRRQS